LSEEYDVKTLVQYMSAIALAVFYLVYLPWTYLSSAMLGEPGYIWIYYFTLVIGLLFPMYYAIGQEKMAWLCLGLTLILDSILWMLVQAAQAVPAVLVLIVGVLFFIAPFLEDRMGNWDMIKNVFHFLKGLLLVLAIFLFAGAAGIDGMIGVDSMNHIMPAFIFMGGGIMVAFAVCLMLYGLFNLFKMYIPGNVGEWFGGLGKIFYMLMVLVFLIGILFNVTAYPFMVNPTWTYATGTSTSIDFFYGLSGLGITNLGAILLIILFIYGMGKISKKFE
jgi:hypothetical protein